jgi:hypothetical protein
MVSIRLFITCFISLIGMPLTADTGSRLATDEFTCNLPDGWRQISNPKSLITAIPVYNNGRFFAVTAEPAAGCPTPCEIEDESDFEKGYWGKFDKNFEKSARCSITNRDFRVIGGIPFRIVDAIREGPPGTDEKLYLEVACTPGNGNIYELLSMKKGEMPENDTDLQVLIGSFAFFKPPSHPWYQPLIHESSNISGVPLLLVALILGAYLLTIISKAQVPRMRKSNVCVIAMCISMANAFWIAGLNSVAGIISVFLFAGFILLLQRLNKERRALIDRGKVVSAPPKQLKVRFWILIGSALLGVGLADIQFAYSGLSFPFILVVDVLTICTFSLIFWIQRRNFFPKSGFSDEKPNADSQPRPK